MRGAKDDHLEAPEAERVAVVHDPATPRIKTARLCDEAGRGRAHHDRSGFGRERAGVDRVIGVAVPDEIERIRPGRAVASRLRNAARPFSVVPFAGVGGRLRYASRRAPPTGVSMSQCVTPSQVNATSPGSLAAEGPGRIATRCADAGAARRSAAESAPRVEGGDDAARSGATIAKWPCPARPSSPRPESKRRGSNAPRSRHSPNEPRIGGASTIVLHGARLPRVRSGVK